MAFLSVAGTSIPVAEGSVSRTVVEVGDRARTFDGTLRETIRNRVSQYSGETTPLIWADASSVFNTLNASTQPQNVSGTLLSSGGATTITMMTRATRTAPQHAGGEDRFVVSWTVEESS